MFTTLSCPVNFEVLSIIAGSPSSSVVSIGFAVFSWIEHNQIFIYTHTYLVVNVSPGSSIPDNKDGRGCSATCGLRIVNTVDCIFQFRQTSCVPKRMPKYYCTRTSRYEYYLSSGLSSTVSAQI